ncbi:glycoside hydrolase family 108 protein [Xanthobacteraceae bacterium A53D]
MAASSFDAALARVLVHEGGYSNHPKDPGGVTLQGVIQRVYDGYRADMGKTQKHLTKSMITDPGWITERDDIYRSQYWDAVRADDLPPGLDYVVFDGAVNSGPSQSAKWLQRALGVTADGQIGAVTLAAAKAHCDLSSLIEDICDRRLAMLKNLDTWPVFRGGWGRRVAEVRRAGKAMVANPPAARTVPTLPPAQDAEKMARAPVSDTSALSAIKTPEGIAAVVPAVTSIINAAANPGPMAWALAAAVLVAVAIGGFYFVQARRGRAV